LDRQNHLISLVAVFLSLGIGILVGASMGVNALVLNQISVIEELQNEIQTFKNETKLYNDQVNQLNQEINDWEKLEEDYFNPFFIQNKLEGQAVKVICQGNFPGEVKEFLDLTGCRYQVFLFSPDVNWDELISSQDKNNDLLPDEDLASLISNLLLERIKANSRVTNLPFFLEEKKILAVYENDSSLLLNEPDDIYEKNLLFVSGTLDPFLANIVKNLSWEQNFIFFLSSEEDEPYQEVSENPYEAGQLRIDNLSGRLKLLELIKRRAAGLAGRKPKAPVRRFARATAKPSLWRR